MSELLLRGGRPWRFAGPADVLVRDGVIARIEPDIDAPGAEVFDVSGRLVLPGVVEAHCHLDKTLYGRAWEPHTAGDTLADRIGNERRRRGELGLPNADCAAALLERMVTAGTSYVRTHTDVYPGAGLGGVEAVRDAVRRLGGRVTVEQVAFRSTGSSALPAPPNCWTRLSNSEWRRSAGSIPRAWTGIRSAISTWSSASRSGTVPESISICTTAACWAPSSWS